MYRKNAPAIILIIGILIFGFLRIIGQSENRKIKIINVGDNWDSKVDSAINLILKTDKDKYDVLIEYCNQIEFSYADFSTTVPPHTIVITSKDMSRNSINNIAAVLVHESNHLYYFNNNIQLPEDEEELNCYKYEYDFLTKLPTVEDWLFKWDMNQIIYYENRLNEK